MTRITVDVNDAWLDAASEVLGTSSKVGTINAALHSFAVRQQAKDILAAFDSVPVDVTDSDSAWRYGGGRDLDRLVEDARGREAV